MSTALQGQDNARLRAAEGEATEYGNGQSEPQQNGHLENGNSSGEDNAQKEKGEEGPPAPVGFWHPSLKHVRREAFSKWLLTTVVLMFFIMGVLSICKQDQSNAAFAD